LPVNLESESEDVTTNRQGEPLMICFGSTASFNAATVEDGFSGEESGEAFVSGLPDEVVAEAVAGLGDGFTNDAASSLPHEVSDKTPVIRAKSVIIFRRIFMRDPPAW